MIESRRKFIQSSLSLGVCSAAPALVFSGSSFGQSPGDPTSLTASELSAAIRRRSISCVEVMRAYLDRIDRYNPVYNAIVSMRETDELIAEARRFDSALVNGDYRGWMHGMPHAVKNLSDAKGLESSAGSPIFAGTIAKQDALFVKRIRDHGAIFIGKTNTPEFGYGSQSYNPVHGVTRNAYDPALTAGGSSGGAAAGLAAHLLPVADGSDMMGSLRNPGAFNNVVGFRPTQGRVSEHPSSDLFYQQLGVSGPMGRTVEDTIRLLTTMTSFDRRFPLGLRDELPGFDAFRAVDLRDFKIGWMGDYDGYLATEPGLIDLCEKSLSDFSSTGAIVEACQPDYALDRLWQTWLTLRHWSVTWAKSLYDDPQTRAQLKPEVIFEYEGSLKLTAADVHRAGIDRADWFRALDTLLDTYDVLALPTAQVFPFSADVHWPKEINGEPMDTYHRWMEVVIGPTLAGLPAVNLPAGFDARGRPMGVQFIGRSGEDKKVLEFALAYERATDYLTRRPNLREST